MEWDVAAGHAIVNAAGGSVTTVDNGPLSYGKSDFANPFFVVRGLREDD
jgi:3'(2'), 5'-bisphosphate nucleotidase